MVVQFWVKRKSRHSDQLWSKKWETYSVCIDGSLLNYLELDFGHIALVLSFPLMILNSLLVRLSPSMLVVYRILSYHMLYVVCPVQAPGL